MTDYSSSRQGRWIACSSRPVGMFVLSKMLWASKKNLWRKNLSKGDRLLRIDFIPTKDSNLRIPDGNEIGADMLLRRPGGKTEGGLDEAVINPIRKNYKRTELNVK